MLHSGQEHHQSSPGPIVVGGYQEAVFTYASVYSGALIAIAILYTITIEIMTMYAAAGGGSVGGSTPRRVP